MKIENSEQKLLLLLESENMLSEQKDIQNILEMVSGLAKDILGASRCSIFMLDEEKKALETMHSDGENRIIVPYDKGIVGTTFAQERAMIVNDPRSHPNFLSKIDEESGYTTKNIITEPLFDIDNNIIGVFEIINKIDGEFDEADSSLLKYFSKHISSIIYNAQKSSQNRDVGLRQEINIAVLAKNEDFLPALTQDIKAIFGMDIINVDSTQNFDFLVKQNRSKAYILIYLIENKEDILAISNFLSHTNSPVIVIGPSSSELALFAGGFQVSTYIGYGEYDDELLKKSIEKNSTFVIKNRKNSSFMMAFIGISGGVGTTTISVNLANLISKVYPFKNVLYVDLSQTKAISNIFLGNPKPSKNIRDILKIKSREIKELLEEGMFRYSNNFYFIPGIQSHIEKDEIFSKDGERALVEFLFDMKKHFDYILVDTGVAEDNDLKLAVEELSDELYLITELSTVHLSILKTFYDILRKAGWRDKIKVIINRADSKSSISVDDAKKIINDVQKDRVTFDSSLPNESDLLRECMNYGELITQKYPNSNFAKAMLRELIGDEVDLQNAEEKAALKSNIFEKIKNLLK